MAGFNIQDFLAEIDNRSGVMRNNRFLVTFPTPRVLLGNGPALSINRTVEFWCEGVNLPGVQLMQHDVKRWTYGPSEKRPFQTNFNSLQCTFISDGDGDIWTFFNNWLQYIIPHDTENGFNSRSQFSVGQTRYPYELAYKQDYATELNIGVYDIAGNKTINLVCKEAFPSQILDIPLAWQDTNNTVRLSVVFEFIDWYIRKETESD